MYAQLALALSLPTEAANFKTVVAMGWVNIVWIGFLLIVGLLWKTGKIGFETIRRGERGLRELFGLPVWPVYHGAHFFVKGILGVSKAPIIPVDVSIKTRAELGDGCVYEVDGLAKIRVGKNRKSLVKAIYDFPDEDKTDIDNASRTRQTRSLMHDGIRRLLTGASSPSALTEQSLISEVRGELCATFASTLDRLYIDSITPVDAQIMASGMPLDYSMRAALINDKPFDSSSS